MKLTLTKNISATSGHAPAPGGPGGKSALSEFGDAWTRFASGSEHASTSWIRKRDQYLDLLGQPGWPTDKIQCKLAQIEGERQASTAQLNDTTGKLDIGRRFFLAARQAINQVIFDNLWVEKVKIIRRAATKVMQPLRRPTKRWAATTPAQTITAPSRRERLLITKPEPTRSL